ncbi:MAG: DUF2232 domain-containing protein [Bacteriovoracaceae bacterium]|jgi:hypothetical protein|nr:hypothetical protein [Halobacteriovoraceae bacterium]MDP7320300.1 DUF2232 domain-containing protein [Bacteriovoracaceae bacterium]
MNVDTSQLDTNTYKRPFLLGFVSALLSVSFFVSVFTPFPIGLSSLIYGRGKGVLTACVALISLVILTSFNIIDPTLIAFMAVSIVIAFILTEVLRLNINPLRGIVSVGIALYFLLVSSSYFVVKKETLSFEKSLINFVEPQRKNLLEMFDKTKKNNPNNKEIFEVEALLGQPKKLVGLIIEAVVVYAPIFIFTFLWINTFLWLKSRRLMQRNNSTQYDDQYLLDYKLPEQFVWLVILSLTPMVLDYLFGASLIPQWSLLLGGLGLSVLGVFYFFQGFGIYLAFLDYLRLTGIIRSIMVVITVLSAPQILAVLGVADVFVNFKKLMTKRKD